MQPAHPTAVRQNAVDSEEISEEAMRSIDSVTALSNGINVIFQTEASARSAERGQKISQT